MDTEDAGLRSRVLYTLHPRALRPSMDVDKPTKEECLEAFVRVCIDSLMAQEKQRIADAAVEKARKAEAADHAGTEPYS